MKWMLILMAAILAAHATFTFLSGNVASVDRGDHPATGAAGSTRVSSRARRAAVPEGGAPAVPRREVASEAGESRGAEICDVAEQLGSLLELDAVQNALLEAALADERRQSGEQSLHRKLDLLTTELDAWRDD